MHTAIPISIRRQALTDDYAALLLVVGILDEAAAEDLPGWWRTTTDARTVAGTAERLARGRLHSLTGADLASRIARRAARAVLSSASCVRSSADALDRAMRASQHDNASAAADASLVGGA